MKKTVLQGLERCRLATHTSAVANEVAIRCWLRSILVNRRPYYCCLTYDCILQLETSYPLLLWVGQAVRRTRFQLDWTLVLRLAMYFFHLPFNSFFAHDTTS